MQLPGVLLLYGCFVVAASVATVLWSLVQAGLDLAERVRRPPGTRASAASHLSRATAGAAVAAVTAAVPAGLGDARLLSALLSAL